MPGCRHGTRAAAWAGVALAACVTSHAEVATFTPLGDLPGGGHFSAAFGVSADGSVVVGWSEANAQISGQLRAFRWTESSGMTPLEHVGPPSSNSIARAVSTDGAVIVGDSGQAVLWTGAGVLLLGECSAIGLGADGATVVGSCLGDEGLEAAMWTQETGWTLFGDLGDEGDLVDSFFSDLSADSTVASGQSMVAEPSVEPIRWTRRRGMMALGDVPGGAHYALAWAISADGSTIVGDAIGDVGLDAFRWTESSGLENLEMATPVVTDSTAQDVSGDGAIVVGAADTLGAMIWDAEHGMRSLQQALVEEHGLELPGWTLFGATAITADGRVIVGLGENPDGDIEAWRVTLPLAAPTADLDGDGDVDGADLGLLLGAWGACQGRLPGCPGDVDDDGDVDGADLGALLAAWGL